jgi:uncharacterized membrane protein
VEKSVWAEDGSQFFLSIVHLGELGLDDGFLGALRRRVEESDFVNLYKLVHHLHEEKALDIGRIRLRVIPDASGATPHVFIREAIAPRSTAPTDGWRGYLGLEG